MKRTVTKLVSILLVTVMCFSVFPVEVFAWGKMTHVYTANEIEDDLYNTGAGSSSVKYAGSDYNFSIPQEFLEAIEAYPDAFRAGALGPDVYPDILTGQMYIHPEDVNIDSGVWVTYLVDAVNKMAKDTEGRKITLAFTLGVILHYCGDLFGHDFVNTFAGGAFPPLLSLEMLDVTSERLNNVLSHMSVESYMDSLLYPDYDDDVYGGIDAPDQFVRDALIFDGTPAAGLNPLYKRYPETVTDALASLRESTKDIFIVGDIVENIIEDFFDEDGNNVPPHYTALLALRNYVNAVADSYRENMEPASAAITRYCDEWAEDIDRGINAFTETCDNISRRLITKETNPIIEKKKEEEREEEKNYFWDMSDLNMESLIEEYYPDRVAKVKAELAEAELYGESFFDLVLIELILKGVITIDMVKSNDGSIMIIKEELSYWADEYGVYMLGIPDIMIDGIPEIPYIGEFIDMLLLKPLWSWIAGEIKNLAAEWFSSVCIGIVSFVTGTPADQTAQEISDFVSSIDDRLEDPELQLDHEQNPYKPSENNFADLNEYMMHLKHEDAEEFEALYNTLVMFKLVLMGPENYSEFVQKYAGVEQTAYQTNTAHVEVSALTVRIRTAKLYLSGTNDNIYVIVYKKEQNGSKKQIACKLLDKSGYDDFEAGHQDDYLVELPRAVALDKIEIALRKTPVFDFVPSMTDDWHCENIQIIPMYAGYEQTAPIDLGGIHLKGICGSVAMEFQEALKVKEAKDLKSQTVTNLQVQIDVSSALWSGTDSDIYLVAYKGDKQWARVCLDKALDNDLERGETERYEIPITKYAGARQGIPLNELRIEFDHTGIDQSNWKDVVVTPCYGSLKLTEPISLGGKKMEDSKWDTDFQKKLKNAEYRDQEPDLSQTVDNVKVQILVSAELYAGTDSDVYLLVYNGDALSEGYELDKDSYNDLEMGDSDTYMFTLSTEIPLDQLGIVFSHDGDDEAFWADVVVTPCSGSAELTDPISVGGKKFENEVWDTDFQKVLKMHYTPIVIEYETSLDDGLLYYMGSLDGGEEWVDRNNELWQNTTLRRFIFFKIFKGFAPEIEYAGQSVFSEGYPAEIILDFTGVWNGVGSERRSQVKDFEYNYPVRGTADVELINGKNEVVYAANGITVINEQVRFTIDSARLEKGYYQMRVSYTPDYDNPTYAPVSEFFMNVFKYGGLGIVTHPQDATLEVGESASFTVKAAGGTTPYTYTWQLATEDSWIDIPQGNSRYSGQGTDTFTYTANAVGIDRIRCKVSDAEGDFALSYAANVTVNANALTIVEQPESVSVTSRETVILSVAADGGILPYFYTWQKLKMTQSGRQQKSEWIDVEDTSSRIIGQGTRSLRLIPDSVGTDTYRCIVRDRNGNTVTSQRATVTVIETTGPLSIATHPQDVTIEAGQKTALTVAASGGEAPYYYTWQNKVNGNWTNVENGSMFADQYTKNLTVTSTSAGKMTIRCVVKDAKGNTVISNEATVTVTGHVNPLSIKTQPKSVTVEAGQKATLTVVPSGGKSPYTYIWQLNRAGNWTGVPNISNYSGQGTGNLTFTSDNAGDVKLRCMVMDANGNTVISNEAKITVKAPAPLSITTQPKDVTVDGGQKATLNVEVSGGITPYTYTWEIPATRGGAWKDIGNYPGQGTNILTYTSNTAGTTRVRCVITDAKGNTVTSNEVTITVKETTAPLSIKSQPRDVTVEAGQTAIFTITADGGKAPYTYTWQMPSGANWIDVKNGSGYSGQGTDTFIFDTEAPVNTRVRCVVKDAAGNTVTSDTAYVTVTEVVVPFGIKTQPKDVTVNTGELAALTVEAIGGTAPYTYTWQIPATRGGGWSEIYKSNLAFMGQNTNTLTYISYTAGEVKVRCVISDAGGNEVISDVAVITVNAAVESFVITSQPMDVTLDTGDISGLFVEVSGGNAPYTYTWQILSNGDWKILRDSAEVFGQGTDALTLVMITPGVNTLRCVITDSDGQEVVSDTATVTVNAVPLAVNVDQPLDVTVEAGETVQLTVKASGGSAPYIYAWKVFNGMYWIGFPDSDWRMGSKTDTLIYTPGIVGTSEYRCEVTDSAGNTVTSETFSVTVKPLAVQINNGETKIELDHGDDETEMLIANVTGGVGPYTYTWYRYQYNWDTRAYEWVNVSATSSYTADTYLRDSYDVRVEVTDSEGTTVTAELKVKVTGVIN